jgi:hypothetical protein
MSWENLIIKMAYLALGARLPTGAIFYFLLRHVHMDPGSRSFAQG